NIAHRIEANQARAYRSMTILTRSPEILAVIQMNNAKSINPDDPIKGIQHAVKIVHNIVTRIMNVTRIHTNRQTAVILYLLHNGGNLFKAAANLRSFAGHRLKRYVNLRILGAAEHFIQALSNTRDSVLRIFVRISAGM